MLDSFSYLKNDLRSSCSTPKAFIETGVKTGVSFLVYSVCIE